MTPTTPRATILDVAAEAGVSKSTVSRVLADSGRFSEDARRRVHEAAARLGFVRDVMASSLASRSSRTIGLLVRDARNPAYGRLHTALQTAALTAGLDVVSSTVPPYAEDDLEVQVLHRLIGSRVQALIVANGVIAPARLLPFASRLPVLVAGRPQPDPGLPSIAYDEGRHAGLLAEHFRSLGHRAVAVLVTMPAISAAEHARATSVTRALRRRGVAVTSVRVGQHERGVANSVDLVARGCVTGIVCPTDYRALEVLRGLRTAGIDVPARVSVSGWDDAIDGLDLIGLTSIRIDIEAVAARSIEVVGAFLRAQRAQPVIAERVAGALVPRSSTGPAPT